MKYLTAISGMAIALALTMPAAAQDDALGEIVVTGSRADGDYYEDEQPVVGLRRTADSAVQAVQIMSDSRDEQVRKREIHAMLVSAIGRASAAGVELVTGDFELTAITLENYQDLIFRPSSRPDTSRVTFYVKSRLAGSTGDAQQRIDRYVAGVPASGRALLEKIGGLALTIINPDQYRDEILRRVAAEATKSAAYFGTDYGVEVSGLDKQIKWAQVSGSEVFLYIPYNFSIRPK